MQHGQKRANYQPDISITESLHDLTYDRRWHRSNLVARGCARAKRYYKRRLTREQRTAGKRDLAREMLDQ